MNNSKNIKSLIRFRWENILSISDWILVSENLYRKISFIFPSKNFLIWFIWAMFLTTKFMLEYFINFTKKAWTIHQKKQSLFL